MPPQPPLPCPFLQMYDEWLLPLPLLLALVIKHH